MSKELVIGSNRHETKVAVLEEDQLVEVFFQRSNEYSLAGSIHKGRVTRVLPGMQSAFVDLGLERDTFLYVSDFFEENEDIEPLTDDRPPRQERRVPEGRSPDRTPREGRESSQPRESREASVSSDTLPAREFNRPVLEAGTEGHPLSGPAEEQEELVASDADADALVPPPPNERSTLEADRNFRGDRRGNNNNRRGRRNRGRGGRGIPENKYAQPSDSGSEPVTAPPRYAGNPSQTASVSSTLSVASPPSAPPSLYEEPSPADVIILPGESLAKYRSAPPKSFERPATTAPVPATVVEPSEPVLHATQAPDIESQREELALADAVLGHHDEALDERLSPLEADLGDPTDLDDPPTHLEDIATPVQSNSPFVVENFEQDEVGDESSEEPLEPPIRPARLEVVETSREHDETIASASEVYVLSATQSSDIEASEIIDEIAPGESIYPAETLLAGGIDFVEEEEDQDAEDSEVEDAIPSSSSLAAGDKPQTAEVRDTAPQALHRVSRRMRRRRGGNRFGGARGDAPRPEGGRPEGSRADAPRTESFAATEPASVSVASAPALQPDNRPARTEPMDEERSERFAERPDRVLPSITDLLKAGQEIIVQIAKEPLGQKGARITSHIALPGRYVVFMPSVNHLGVSRKIASDEERQRLKRILQAHRVGTTGGFIVRTAGEGVPENEIAADMSFLYTLWLDIRSKAEKKPAPCLLHHDLDLVQRILRDQVTDEFKAIWVDNEELYESTLHLHAALPAHARQPRQNVHAFEAPIFRRLQHHARVGERLSVRRSG